MNDLNGKATIDKYIVLKARFSYLAQINKLTLFNHKSNAAHENLISI